MWETTALSEENNMGVIFFHDPEQEAVFLTFTIRLGFVYRYVYISEEPHSQELNHGFSHVFASFIHLLGTDKPGRKYRVTPFRGTICVSLKSDKDNYLNDIQGFFDALFGVQPTEQGFESAKEDAMRRLEQAYTDPMRKAMFHMLEYSDKNKGFMFQNFSQDMKTLDYQTFCRYIQSFIHPANAFLSVSGNVGSGFTAIHLNNRADTYKPFTLCGENQDPALQRDAHKVLSGRADFRLSCQKIFVTNPEISLTQQYFLLGMLRAAEYKTDCDISVDTFDASITSWGNTAARPHEIRSLFMDKTWVEEAQRAVIKQIQFQRKNEPETFYMWWSNLLMEGINLESYLELVMNCTAQTLTALFDRANIAVTEGAVIVKNVIKGEGKQHE